MADACSERSGWLETEVTFQRHGVGKGGRDIAGLHGDELAVGLKIVASRQEASTDKFLLKGIHEIQEVFWLAITYII